MKASTVVPKTAARSRPSRGSPRTLCRFTIGDGIQSLRMSSVRSRSSEARSAAGSPDRSCTITSWGSTVPPAAERASKVMTASSPSPWSLRVGSAATPTTVSVRSRGPPSELSRSPAAMERVTGSPTSTPSFLRRAGPRAISEAVDGRRPRVTVGGAVPEGSMTKTEAPASLMAASPMSATVIPWTRGSEARRSVVSLAIEKLVLPTTASQGKPWRPGSEYSRSTPPTNTAVAVTIAERGGSPAMATRPVAERPSRRAKAKWVPSTAVVGGADTGEPAGRGVGPGRAPRSLDRRSSPQERGRHHHQCDEDGAETDDGQVRAHPGIELELSADPDRVATRQRDGDGGREGARGRGHGQGPDPGDQTDLEAAWTRAHAVLARPGLGRAARHGGAGRPWPCR